jgi:hypothetical protein
MNLLLRTLAVGGLLAASHAFAVEAFEGKVSLAITAEKGRTMDMNYSMKAGKLRMDMNAEGHQMSTIMDMANLEMLMLMPEQQMYMVMPMKKPVQQAMEKQGDATTDITRTGKTEKILGYTCDQLLVTDKAKGTVTELWLAPDLGMFMGLGGGGPMGGGGGMFGGGRRGGGGPAAAKWEEAIKGKGGFPLRVVSHDAKGAVTFKMEATSIEPGSLSDSLFTPPEGYRKFSMPDMGGMNPFKQG